MARALQENFGEQKIISVQTWLEISKLSKRESRSFCPRASSLLGPPKLTFLLHEASFGKGHVHGSRKVL